MRNGLRAALITALCLSLTSPAFASYEDYISDESHDEHSHDDAGLGDGQYLPPRGCTPASASQRAAVNEGNAKAARFLSECRARANNSH